MSSREESLDSEFLAEEQPFGGQLEVIWSHIALACLGFEVVLFLSSFSSSYEEKIMDVRFTINLVSTVVILYLLWYVKLVCNKLLNVSSVNLPTYLLMGFSCLTLVFYFIRYDYSNAYLSILTSFQNLFFVISKIWLVVAVLRISKPNSLYYLRLWAFSVLLSMAGNVVLPFLVFSSSTEVVEYQQKISQFIRMLPELTLLFLIFTEPRLNVVKGKPFIQG